MPKPLKPLHPALATGSLAELLFIDATRELEIVRQAKIGLQLASPADISADKDAIALFRDTSRAKSNAVDLLPRIKRLSYDESLIRLADSTISLKSEEIIGQLGHVSFPFDQFWIEGPNFSNPNRRLGALITADQNKNEFSFVPFEEHLFGEQDGSDKSTEFPSRLATTDGKYVRTIGIPIRVSPSEGITFDTDELLKQAERIQNSNGNNDASVFLDEPFYMADFLTRALVVLSSPNVPNNFCTPKTRKEFDLEGKNRRRKDMGFAPILTVSPIKIDLAQINPRLLETERPIEARQLLGWTSVCRSKEVRKPDGTLWLRKKDGKPWTRKPHDRKIAAPVDRRNAEREIFSSNPNLLHIDIENGRPVKVRHDAAPTDKPEPSK